MKKITINDNNPNHYQGSFYLPSVTEIKKAAAHVRRLRNNSCNYFTCEYYPNEGVFRYAEFTDPSSYTDSRAYCVIHPETGTGYEDPYSTPEATRQYIKEFATGYDY